MLKIAIIGGGFTGLNVAKRLEASADVTVFEKARGVSGRMSTRRAEPYWFDHGAQYFTARHADFKAFVQAHIQNGLVRPWAANYVEMDYNCVVDRKDWSQHEPRYVAVPGMNALAKHLAQNLNVKLNTRIVELMQVNEKWNLLGEEGEFYEGFDWVVLTAPSPQAANLLPTEFAHLDSVKAVQMRACFSLMLGFSKTLVLPFDAARIKNADISWLAVNSNKPGREGSCSLLAHSSETYAERHIDDDRQAVLAHLCTEVSNVIGQDVQHADYQTLHGWRYANNAVRKATSVFVDPVLKLAAGGDWCHGGRVEGAFLAAKELVEALKLQEV